MGFFEKLKQGLSKTASSISSVFTASELDDEFYDDLEESLIVSDLGMDTTEAVMKASGMPVLADDSGLMVDALDGAPGVYSARYGHKSSDAERIAYLLENLKDVPAERRTAKFVCVITCLWPDGRRIAARGECPGQILFAPKGTGGFGYDPVFYLPELEKTYAELASEEKNAISHRARALQAFCRIYREEFEHDDK